MILGPSSAEIHRIGPAIQVVAFEGEFYASVSIGWMQSGRVRRGDHEVGD